MDFIEVGVDDRDDVVLRSTLSVVTLSLVKVGCETGSVIEGTAVSE